MSKFIADHSLNIAHINHYHWARPVFGCDYCMPAEKQQKSARQLIEDVERTLAPLLHHNFEKTYEDVLMLLEEYFNA